MGCNHFRFRTKDGEVVTGFMCGPGPALPACGDCGVIADYLCDYPVGDDRTCDRMLCPDHAREIVPGVHYCHGHYAEWRAWRENAGLAEIIPFSPIPL
jgi:hypothetical protein